MITVYLGGERQKGWEVGEMERKKKEWEGEGKERKEEGVRKKKEGRKMVWFNDC